MWMLFFLALLQVSQQVKNPLPSCQLQIGSCQYKLVLTDSFGEGCNSRENYLTESETAKTGNRRKRSTSASTETHSVSIELHKIRRRLIRVQSNLVKSMGDLSKRLLRGVRRLEEKVDNLESQEQSKGDAKGGDSDLRCPHGFEFVKSWDSCYMLSNFNATWYEARDYCAALESELVGLKNEKEHNLLAFIIKNSPVYQKVEGWWMSGTFHDTTRQWMWKSETLMQPFTFIKWAPEEPNEETLQCVFMARDSNHLWQDAMCTEAMNFMCEIPRRKP